jgi:hypothetical protein
MTLSSVGMALSALSCATEVPSAMPAAIKIKLNILQTVFVIDLIFTFQATNFLWSLFEATNLICSFLISNN